MTNRGARFQYSAVSAARGVMPQFLLISYGYMKAHGEWHDRATRYAILNVHY